MRSLKVGLVVVIILLLGWFFTAPNSNEAKAADPCTISVSGTVALVNCGGVSVGTVQLPTVKVTTTLPPLPQPTKIVKVPGPTIRIPGPTETVTVRGPVRTKVIEKPSKTQTVTVQPQPSSLPSPTPETSTGQSTPDHAMIGPATPVSPQSNKPIINFGDGKTTVVEASLGIVATLALIGLLLGMYYAGYTFGFREADSKNAKFMENVLDKNA